MTNNNPFHHDYVRALNSGNVEALKKLIRRALGVPKDYTRVSSANTRSRSRLLGIWRARRGPRFLAIARSRPPLTRFGVALSMPTSPGLRRFYVTAYLLS